VADIPRLKGFRQQKNQPFLVDLISGAP